MAASHSPLIGLYLAVKLLHILPLLPTHACALVGPSGLEPPTSCLSGTRSNHLSYEPVFKCRMQNAECRIIRFTWFSFISAFAVVEMMGFEPMTPCLQGRCSPSWATPPYLSLWDFAFSPKRSFKIEQRIERTLTKPSFYVAYTIVMHGRFSIERRWSSRTFRYGYLVTT